MADSTPSKSPTPKKLVKVPSGLSLRSPSVQNPIVKVPSLPPSSTPLTLPKIPIRSVVSPSSPKIRTVSVNPPKLSVVPKFSTPTVSPVKLPSSVPSPVSPLVKSLSVRQVSNPAPNTQKSVSTPGLTRVKGTVRPIPQVNNPSLTTQTVRPPDVRSVERSVPVLSPPRLPISAPTVRLPSLRTTQAPTTSVDLARAMSRTGSTDMDGIRGVLGTIRDGIKSLLTQTKKGLMQGLGEVEPRQLSSWKARWRKESE